MHNDSSQPAQRVPHFPCSGLEEEFRTEKFLPAIELDNKYILNGTGEETSPAPSKTCTACTIVKQRTKDKQHQIITGARKILDDVLLWLNCQSTIIRVSFKVKKCKLFNERFEYMGKDIMTTGQNTTAQSKYGLVTSWKRPTTGNNLCFFVSFCNFYARFC